jgi:polysaccharide biosynthesis transport protein
MSEPSDRRQGTGALVPGAQGGELVHSSVREHLSTPEHARLYAVPPEEKGHFWDYWRVLVRRRWTVITFFLVTVVVVMVWLFTARPVFTATAMLRIEKEEPRVLKFEEVLKAESEPNYYQTQNTILQSRAVASRVIDALDLSQHAEFQRTGVLAKVSEVIVSWIPSRRPPTPQESDDLAFESPVTNLFLKRLSVDPVRSARLVKVSFESYDPVLAARVVNTLGEEFIAQHLDDKVEATRYATQFLANQMEEARAKLQVSEERVNEFLKRNEILFVMSDKVPDRERQDLTTLQLTTLSDSLLKAQAERISKESVVHQALRQDVESVPAVLHSPLVTKLKEELASLEAEYRDYPRIQRTQQKIAEVRRRLRQEIDHILNALDAEYRAALLNERTIQQAVDRHRSLARQLGDQMARYNVLRRDVDTTRELYTSLLSRLKETQITSALLTSNITIVDRAEVPLTPSKPRKVLNFLVASLVGLVGGVGLAFFFEYLDTNIKDAKEVEAVLQVPSLGFVPSQAVLQGHRARRRGVLAKRSDASGPFALIAHAEMESVLAEAFRNLRTSLLSSSPDHPPKTFMVTSIHSEDGKTSLATNLAITLAQLGHGEVLLVDGDMRRPSLHELFGVSQVPGLSTLLTGQAEPGTVVNVTTVPNLYVMSAGRIPFNPAELMASTRLGQAIAVLEERFAHIVFDVPPLLGVSDALILAPKVEGVLLVLRHGRASRDTAQRAVQLLAFIRARLLGVILNDADGRAASAGDYVYAGHSDHYVTHGRARSRNSNR